MLAFINSGEKKRYKRIEITADGKIQESEYADLAMIQAKLEKISMTAYVLQLWAREKISIGEIDLRKSNSYY